MTLRGEGPPWLAVLAFAALAAAGCDGDRSPATSTTTPGGTASTRSPAAERSASGTSADETVMGFPLHPEATHWCDGSVSGGTEDGAAHITWEAFTVSKPPDEVVTFYRERLSDDALATSASSSTWSIDTARASSTLEVSAAPPPPTAECGAVPDGARTYVFVSTLVTAS